MYKIVLDSCGETTRELNETGLYSHVPLEIEIDGVNITDDETFDQKDFLERIKASRECPKSACPSPDAYMKAYQGPEDRVYVITLSGKLSGSYNSAKLAAELYEEEHGDGKKIYVFDSRSASVGETIIAYKVQSLEEEGKSFQEVIDLTEEYIELTNTFFVLEDVETLRKAGRLSNIKAMVANTLNIKPILGSTKEGAIQQLGQARGIKKALGKMVDEVIEKTDNCAEKVLGIAHCNCPERAEMVKEAIEKIAKFKKVVIVNTQGVSTMYANDGGIIIVV